MPSFREWWIRQKQLDKAVIYVIKVAIKNLIKFLVKNCIERVPPRKMARPKQKKTTETREDHGQMALQGIRRMLYRKELVPGQKISCRDLTERLGMSLTPVIQALKYMEFQGFVRHEPNRGYFITPFDLDEVEEIYELRELLEPSLIPGTVRHLDDAGKAKLKEALEAHRSAHREDYLRERIFKNVEFHLTLASLSNKPTQIRVLRNLFDLLLLKYGGNQGSGESMDLSDDEHQKVYDCIVRGDVKAAQRILSRHVVHVKKQVLKRFRLILEERETPPLWEP